MITVEAREARIVSVDVSDDLITAELVDGRAISVPSSLVMETVKHSHTNQMEAPFEIIEAGTTACSSWVIASNRNSVLRLYVLSYSRNIELG